MSEYFHLGILVAAFCLQMASILYLMIGRRHIVYGLRSSFTHLLIIAVLITLTTIFHHIREFINPLIQYHAAFLEQGLMLIAGIYFLFVFKRFKEVIQ